jgi:hypothetical protein
MTDKEGNPEERLALRDFLKEVGDSLLCGASFKPEALESTLDDVLSDIKAIHSQYVEPSCCGADTVREFMLEALDLYVQCLDEMKSFLADQAEGHIHRGLAQAEEADDLLSAVESVIADHKDALSRDLRA